MSGLRLLKYVRSFSDGRVRIRHPALRREDVSAVLKAKLPAIDGVLSLECNTLSGSALILYDSARLPRERLFAVGEAWAAYLDAVQAGRPAQAPDC
ncbi:HMA2 domain-containing protein [Desulfovibrio sp. SGI.169]|uniref:HMA2 domain-containing protein n=1 Tax=Desulfovibrio sp. SGI.169 TaxID=3420561 RepID=UPI003CFF8D1B